jgi:hypothetical protein
LKSLHEWEGFRPYNFFLAPVLADGGYPANVNPEHFRLVAPFESDQTKWKHLKCLNIGDPKDRQSYGLTTSFTSAEYGKRAVVETFENLFHRYMQHAEAKSLGPDGEPCKADTRGLLGRSHIIAGKHRRIGKESDRRWEEGDDLESLMYVPMEYEQPGEQAEDPSLTRASERLIRLIKGIGIRELVRFGLGRRILEKLCRRQPLDRSVLREYERLVREYKQCEITGIECPTRRRILAALGRDTLSSCNASLRCPATAICLLGDLLTIYQTLLARGYFPKELPPAFTTESLAQYAGSRQVKSTLNSYSPADNYTECVKY